MTHIAIASPIRPSANSGNDVTAERWAEHLRAVGHIVDVVATKEDSAALPAATHDLLRRADLLIALHARRAEPISRWWSQNRQGAPLVVALAGTDLYRDMPADEATMANVTRADALIVLQDQALERLGSFDTAFASKAHVIHQSVQLDLPERTTTDDEFRVVVLAHLRPVKDPLLSARAACLLPAESRVVVHHAGRAHDSGWEQQARAEAESNGRYVWHQELDAVAALALLASATVLACTSVSEGGANVVTEALALGVPVIGTRIGGNVGLLGSDHPGLFPVGDEVAMAALLSRLETDPDAMAELAAHCDGRRQQADPATERAALAALVEQLT